MPFSTAPDDSAWLFFRQNLKNLHSLFRNNIIQNTNSHLSYMQSELWLISTSHFFVLKGLAPRLKVNLTNKFLVGQTLGGFTAYYCGSCYKEAVDGERVIKGLVFLSKYFTLLQYSSTCLQDYAIS